MSIPRGHVLVVEDEMPLRFELIDAFEEAGFMVLEAGTADAALNILLEKAVAALVTDVEMPGRLDGLGLAEIALLLDPERPVVICTGRSPAGLSRAPAAALLLLKPCPSEVVVAAISEALRGRRTDPPAAA